MAAVVVVVQWLDAEAIARQVQGLRLGLVQREGEHAVQLVEQCHPLLFEQMEDDLGVARAAEDMALGDQSLAQGGVIVDLAVHGQDQRAVLVHHRLRAGGAEVDDRQARMAEEHAGGGIPPLPGPVRAAMMQRAERAPGGVRRHVGPNGTKDPAHRRPGLAKPRAGCEPGRGWQWRVAGACSRGSGDEARVGSHATRHVGGTERYLNRIVAHMAERGHQVTIVCRSHEAAAHPAVRFEVLRPVPSAAPGACGPSPPPSSATCARGPTTSSSGWARPGRTTCCASAAASHATYSRSASAAYARRPGARGATAARSSIAWRCASSARALAPGAYSARDRELGAGARRRLRALRRSPRARRGGLQRRRPRALPPAPARRGRGGAAPELWVRRR